MATKKGTCSNCKRPDVSIQAFGLCPGCYCAAHGLEGEKREDALAKARVRLRSKEGKPGTVEDLKTKKEIEALAAELSDQEVPDPVDAESEPVVANEEFPVISLVLEFANDDIPLYDWILARSKKERRTPKQQVMSLLDNHFLAYNAGPFMAYQPSGPKVCVKLGEKNEEHCPAD